MDEIFGLSMNIVLVVLVAIMALCLLSVAAVAIFNRVVFKMAVRNPPRRKTQSILIIFGLMLATLITSAALTTGDTIDKSITSVTYEGLGEVDQIITYSSGTGDVSVSPNSEPIPASLADDLQQQFADDPDIEAFMPILITEVPALNQEERLSEPVTTLTGIDPARVDAFGGLQAPNGGAIDDGIFDQGQAIISETLAEDTGTSIGQTITVYLNDLPFEFEVGAIAKDSILVGDPHGVALPIEQVQEMTGLEGMARFIAVSNVGGVEAGVDHSDAAVAKIEQAIEGQNLGVDPIKADSVEDANLFASLFTSIFIVLGLFSIAAGILLIFLIFMMLASERRSEMGMARAVGMRQGHLVQQFLTEGTLYDLGAALVGAVLGVIVSFIMLTIMGQLLGDELDLTLTFSLRSVIIAYALGVTVTFITIIFASTRAAKLNIVAAIRDLPEAAGDKQARPSWVWWRKIPRFGPRIPGIGIRWVSLIFFPLELIPNLLIYIPRVLVWLVRMLAHVTGWGPLLTPVGLLFMLWGWSRAGESWSMAIYSIGISLLGFGVMLILRRWFPQRIVFTTVSAILLFWWLSPTDGLWGDIVYFFTPDNLEGDFEMFFISGIMMVTFATLLVMWNAEVIVWLVSLFGKLFARWLPAVKTAVAYPLASKTKTGLTLAMFSLIVFSLVAMSTINANFIELFTTDEAGGGWDIQATVNQNNPIDDFRAELAGSDVNTDEFIAVGSVDVIDAGNNEVRVPGSDDWDTSMINGVNAEFAKNTEMPLKTRAVGYDTDEAVWNAIANDPSVAVVDAFTGGPSEFGAGPDQLNLDIDQSQPTFEPVQIEMADPESGEMRTVTVIGVIDDTVSMAFGIYMSQQGVDEIFGAPDFNQRFVKLSNNSLEHSKDVAQNIEAALLEKGVQAESIEENIRDLTAQSAGFLNLIQGFMGLGLLVGIAALGVVSFRAVVERRQQIGMMRAIGFQKNMVAATFLVEAMVVAVLGVLSGLFLGLVLSYNLVNSDDFSNNADFGGFVVPWLQLIVMVVIALGAAALMTIIPSRNAASVPVAEALRYE